jgi:bis(5'-nucleosidyl)-tetraphosphatase
LVDERSAGAVMFYMEETTAEPEYLLLHYTAGHWDFPKGNIEAGESEKQAAIREIREETGITDVEFLDSFRMKIEYKYRHGRRLVQKEVVLFLAQTHTRQVTISHEHIGFAWRKFDEAMQQLTYRNARNLLSAAKDYLQQRSLAYR